MSKTNFLEDINFNNVDSVSYPPNDPNGIDRPYLCCAVGPPGRGKTYNLCKLIQGQIRDREIDKLWICTPTYHNNKGYFDTLDIKKEICEDMNDAYGFIEKLKEEQLKIKNIWKQIHEQFPNLEEWIKFYKFMCKNEEIKKNATMRHTLLQNVPLTLDAVVKNYNKQNNIPEEKDLLTESEFIIDACDKKGGPENYYNSPPIALLFCDDIQGSKLMSNSKKNPFINFVIKFRHYFCSIIFGVHSISNGLPLIIRPCITDWLVFKVDDPKAIKKIHEEAFGSIGNPDDFEDMFKNTIDGETHRFLVTHKKGLPMKARLNWNIMFNDANELLEPFKKEDVNNKKRNLNEFTFLDNNNKKQKININF